MDYFDYFRYIDGVCYKLIDSGRLKGKKIIIFPYGSESMILKNILNDKYGIKEWCIVDNRLSKLNQQIKGSSFLRELTGEDYFVLLCSDNKKIWKELRMDLAENYKSENYYDFFSFQPFIYSDIRSMELECAAREINSKCIKGSVAEAGVYKGDFAKKINFLFPDRKLYLFDTFEGFDERDLKDDKMKGYTISESGRFGDVVIEQVLNQMSNPEMVEIRKGYFPDTTEGIEDEFAFVSLDMDLYAPIKAGLEYFYPRLVKGGYIVIHDCAIGHKTYKGARIALLEFCKEYDVSYVMLMDTCGTAVITK